MVYLYSHIQHGCVLQLWVPQPWSLLYNRLKSIKYIRFFSLFFRIEYHPLVPRRAITHRWMCKGAPCPVRLLTGAQGFDHVSFGIPSLHPNQRRTGIPALQKLTKLGEATSKPGKDIQTRLIPDASTMQKHAEIRGIF